MPNISNGFIYFKYCDEISGIIDFIDGHALCVNCFNKRREAGLEVDIEVTVNAVQQQLSAIHNR